jgi:hypothetical protein
MYGAWASAEGKEMAVELREPGSGNLRRHFRLYGSFHGADLAMDDHKTMFMYFRPDGALTPVRSYTSPVPEKHATVTLQWGGRDDFDRLCAGLNEQ